MDLSCVYYTTRIVYIYNTLCPEHRGNQYCSVLCVCLLPVACIYHFQVRASFLKALGFRQAASKQKSVFAFRPNMGAINSFAATGFRRLSLGGGSRRGSLEPFSDSSGLPNPQDVSTLLQPLYVIIVMILVYINSLKTCRLD